MADKQILTLTIEHHGDDSIPLAALTDSMEFFISFLEGIDKMDFKKPVNEWILEGMRTETGKLTISVYAKHKS